VTGYLPDMESGLDERARRGIGVQLQNVRLSHIFAPDGSAELHHVLAQTAFVVCHKSEPLDILLRTLWYLPIQSPILVVTNGPQQHLAEMKHVLQRALTSHTNVYLIHQKDRTFARLFAEHGVTNILGPDRTIVDGKGEGMYLGALCAHLLGSAHWLVYFDADNFMPSALLEYTLALGTLFWSQQQAARTESADDSAPTHHGRTTATAATSHDLHAVRINWAGKPDVHAPGWDAQHMGRCTQVVAPVVNALLAERLAISHPMLTTSNAGEQGMTMETARRLRFSSGYSIETFQLLDFFAQATHPSCRALLQQYQANSAHVHEKRGANHIRRMIAESLGSFGAFEHLLTPTVRRQLRQIQRELDLEFVAPRICPALDTLAVQADAAILEEYRLADASAWKRVSAETYQLPHDEPTPAIWEEDGMACG
jgi:mannosyl-3-phosphoglycerate synthase